MTRAQRHQLRRHWREPREKETDAGETRDAGTCVSHGLPMATHAANVRGYRPYSFRTTLPVHVREKRTYSIRNSVGCTTRTTTRLYNGKREVRFVCVHTRGRVNWFRLRVRCHDVAIRSKHAMKPRYRRLRAPRRDILTIEWRSFGHNPLCKEVGEWNTYTISSLALNWKTMLTFSCFPCICSFLFFFFFESFDRDDGMPLDVANIEISIVASISLCIPPLFPIYISILCIFIYPSWQKDENNFVEWFELSQIVILVFDSKLSNQSRSEKEFSSSPICANVPFFLCPSVFIPWCTWSRTQLRIIIRVQRIRTLF